MNVYFTASRAAKDQYLSHYQIIYEYLWGRGHRVIADHILKDSPQEMVSREDRMALHKKIETSITSADFMVAEVSFPSISVGYEIAYALQIGRPVLVLYTEGEAPQLLGVQRESKLMIEKYTVDNLPRIIDDFLTSIVSRAELRFTFFITPQIASYLEDVAKKQRLPKAVYLRKLIERTMHSES